MNASDDIPVDFLERDLIEVGWLLLPSSAHNDLEAAATARGAFMERLSRLFPSFNWVVPEAWLSHTEVQDPTSPVQLLELAERERDRHGWDFAILATNADLKSHLKSFTVGTPSQTLGVAVLSTARLGDRYHAASDAEDELLARRIANLAMHLLGDLNGLEHSDDPLDFMHPPDDVDVLDRMSRFGDTGLRSLGAKLRASADPRLEETAQEAGTGPGFYLRALWHNRRAVLGAVMRSRPWLFPYRLSKLTTAAVSAMTVLLISAEAWDLGMTQSTSSVISLSILSIVSATGFVVHRQRLLLRRSHRAATEQRASVLGAIMLSIFLGMVTTYVLLFGATFIVSHLLFTHEVAIEWAAALDGRVLPHHYLLLSGFTATIGLVIGALGATFESHEYFRHVALVDEEA